ncbi:MAG: TolC family protein [Acidobacteriaceae bacterium]|nr:TolC family protein [Acidobacteriaceae bacterium]
MKSTQIAKKFLKFVLAAVATAAAGLAQQPSQPELTLDQAIQQALANNSALKTAGLETERTADDLAANKTKRFASTQITTLAGQLLTKPSVTFQQGSLGTYAATGPIPATNQKIEIPRKPAAAVFASISQPLSTLYRIHLHLTALSFGLQATRQEQEKTRLEVIDQVRRAYYTVVQAQSTLDSLEASLPFYKESKRLAGENLKRETVLESDLLGADAQLLKTQNAVSDALDQVATASEKLNDLMGRDIHTQFRVVGVTTADTVLETTEALEATALQNRPELKKAKLEVQQADYEARAKKAEYIPDVNAGLFYYTTANFQNALPKNIAVAGFELTWEPWDWGRRKQEIAERRVKEEQAKVAVNSTQRAVLLEVRNAWRQLENTRRQLQLAEATEREDRQRLKETQEQVKREAVLTKVLFRAQSDLASADDRQQQALAAFWQARADLKKAIGEQ